MNSFFETPLIISIALEIIIAILLYVFIDIPETPKVVSLAKQEVVNGVLQTTDELGVTREQRSAEQWLSYQTRGVKNCVKTLGDGIFKDYDLYTKLEFCNADESTRMRVVN